MNNIDVSIIIVNYNTCKMTKECIDSIYAKTIGVTFEVILVDNASSDGSKEMFELDKRITYIYNTDNLGFGGANNIGVNISRGRNILFLNSDTLLINNAVKVLSDYCDTNPNIGSCGGNLFSADGNLIHSFSMMSPLIYTLNSLLFNKLAVFLWGKNYEYNTTEDTLNVRYVTGADLMVKKKVLKEVGAFDTRFFMYCEEAELSHRIRNAKFEIVSVPEAKIIHLVGKSFDADKQINRIRYYRISNRLYCELHYGKIYAFIERVLWKMTILSRLFFYGIISSDKRTYWTKIKEQCYL